jgi:hypothetical protein
LIPLHISTREVFTQYATYRDRLMPGPASPCFLLNDYGRRLDLASVHRTFYDLSRQIGLRGPADHTGPRLHDFRQNAEARKMPNRNLKTYRKILEGRRLAMSSGSCDSALFFDVRQLPL